MKVVFYIRTKIAIKEGEGRGGGDTINKALKVDTMYTRSIVSRIQATKMLHVLNQRLTKTFSKDY